MAQQPSFQPGFFAQQPSPIQGAPATSHDAMFNSTRYFAHNFVQGATTSGTTVDPAQGAIVVSLLQSFTHTVTPSTGPGSTSGVMNATMQH